MKARNLKLEERARLLRSKGTSLRETAQQCKRSEGWVRLAQKRGRIEAAEAPEAEPESVERGGGPTSPPVVEPDVTVDAEDGPSLDQVTAMIRTARRSAANAERDGNHGAAQKYMRDATALLVVKARLERAQAGQDDAVSIPRAELAAAQEAVRERLQRLAARPLTCEQCGRELRMAIARKDKD